MLLQLENSNKEDINKLMNFARQNHLELSLVDDDDKHFLPGKPLSDDQLTNLIESSRNTGNILLKDAHLAIRNNFNAG